jgi:hypothetical protein
MIIVCLAVKHYILEFYLLHLSDSMHIVLNLQIKNTLQF